MIYRSIDPADTESNTLGVRQVKRQTSVAMAVLMVIMVLGEKSKPPKVIVRAPKHTTAITEEAQSHTFSARLSWSNFAKIVFIVKRFTSNIYLQN